MTNHRARERSSYVMNEDSPWPFSTKMTLAMFGLAAGAAAAWFNLKADVSTLDDKSAAHTAQFAIITSQLSDMNRKLDRIENQREGSVNVHGVHAVSSVP